MPDTFQTTVRFGGTLKRSDLAELTTLLANSGGYVDWDESGPYDLDQLERDAAAKEPACVTHHKAYYDTYDTLCGWLTSHDMPWSWHQDGKYEYDPDMRVWFPDMGTSATSLATADGAAVLTLSDLRKALENGQTLQELIDSLAPFEREIPPLVLDE